MQETPHHITTTHGTPPTTQGTSLPHHHHTRNSPTYHHHTRNPATTSLPHKELPNNPTTSPHERHSRQPSIIRHYRWQRENLWRVERCGVSGNCGPGVHPRHCGHPASLKDATHYFLHQSFHRIRGAFVSSTTAGHLKRKQGMIGVSQEKKCIAVSHSWSRWALVAVARRGN